MATSTELNQRHDFEVLRRPVPSPVYQETPEEPELSLGALFEILTQHLAVFFSIFLFVLALGVAYLLVSHKKYASTMELLVTNTRGASVITPGRAESPAALPEVTEEELNSQAEVLQSRDVLDEVVDPGWGSVPLTQRSEDAISLHEKGVGTLQKELVVAPVRKSYLLNAQLTTRNPYESTQVLNKLLAAFLSKKRQLSSPAGLSQMFTQQSEQYRKQWQDAQSQLSSFQQKFGMVSVTDQEDLLQKEILATTTALQTSNAEVAFSRQKMAGDQAEIKTMPSRLDTHITNIPDTGSIDQLHTKLNELSLRRTELLTKYRPDDRLVQQIDQQIIGVQKALQDGKNYLSAETSTDVNPIYQSAQQDLSENRAKVAALEGRNRELSQQLQGLQDQLHMTERDAETYNDLQHRVAQAEQGYQLNVQKRDEASMAEVMDENQLLDVAVAQRPSFSAHPVSPKPVTDIILTIATGLFLGLVGVFFAHNSRSTVSSPRDLELLTRYPTLASVPVHKGLRRPEQMA